MTGENGAGKSTLMRIIAGLAKPTSGTVSVHGSIGYMAHASMLYDDLSARENLQYFTALYGSQGDFAELLRTVGLDPDLRRPVRDYSQGMRQRLSLARAILHDPEVLLLDEPFSNVDAGSATQMVTALRGWRDRGKTIIVITHQPGLIENIADRSVNLIAGKMDTVNDAHKVRA